MPQKRTQVDPDALWSQAVVDHLEVVRDAVCRVDKEAGHDAVKGTLVARRRV